MIGIDPGVASTGYAVVERAGSRLQPVDFGVVRTAADAPLAARLVDLRASLAEVIARTEPGAAAVERLFFNSNAKTAMAVGQASGVALLAAAEAGIPVSHYTPSEVKQSVVGVGAATKRQVQAMVAALLGLAASPRPADAADACALAISHLNRAALRRAVTSAARAGP